MLPGKYTNPNPSLGFLEAAYCQLRWACREDCRNVLHTERYVERLAKALWELMVSRFEGVQFFVICLKSR